MKKSVVRTVVAIVALMLVAACSSKRATFADAMVMLDQARDASDPAKELELTKKAWLTIRQIAESQPTSDVAIKFATRGSIGRLNLAQVFETLCLLEPTSVCLAELAWDKRDAAIQFQLTNHPREKPHDPAYSIGSALVNTGQFQLARSYAARLGVKEADTRRALFRFATSEESSLFGRGHALKSLALITSADDRDAAAEGLPPIPSPQQRSELQAQVQAQQGEANYSKKASRLTEIIATQVRLGFADDAKSTIDALIATISETERIEEWAISSLRIASIARHMVGDEAGSREALRRLCEHPDSDTENSWSIEQQKKRRAMTLMECGIAQALSDNIQAATDTALSADAFERSVIMSYLIEPMLRQERFVEAFAAARLMVDQFRDYAIQYIFAAALSKGRRPEALEFARNLEKSDMRAMSLLLVAKHDIDANRHAEAKALLHETGQLPEGMYDYNEWRLVRAVLYARLGDMTTASSILKSETEQAFKSQHTHRLALVASTYGMLRQFGDARKVISAIPSPVDQVDALITYSIGVTGCDSNPKQRWGSGCKDEWQVLPTYFPREAIQWASW